MNISPIIFSILNDILRLDRIQNISFLRWVLRSIRKTVYHPGKFHIVYTLPNIIDDFQLSMLQCLPNELNLYYDQMDDMTKSQVDEISNSIRPIVERTVGHQLVPILGPERAYLSRYHSSFKYDHDNSYKCIVNIHSATKGIVEYKHTTLYDSQTEINVKDCVLLKGEFTYSRVFNTNYVMIFKYIGIYDKYVSIYDKLNAMILIPRISYLVGMNVILTKYAILEVNTYIFLACILPIFIVSVIVYYKIWKNCMHIYKWLIACVLCSGINGWLVLSTLAWVFGTEVILYMNCIKHR